MSRYLLPCNCGENATIEIGQAGQTLACEKCGEPLDVPTMREIRRLTAVNDAADAEGPTWSDLQGMLFAGGLVITLVGLVLSGFLIAQRLQLQTRKPPLPDYTEINHKLDGAPIDIVLDVWNYEVEQVGLGGRDIPPYVRDRRNARFWELLLVGGLLIVASGIGCVIGAFVVQSKR